MSEILSGLIPAPPPGALSQDTDRITLHFVFHHEHFCRQPITIEMRASEMLETVDSPFSRESFQVGKEWQAIDTAWLNRVSFLIIRNHEQKYLSKPNEEQKLEDKKRILELGYEGHPPFLVRPGRMFLAEPSEVLGMRMRCQYGVAEVSVAAIPR